MAIFDLRTNYTSEENLKEGTILVAQPFLDEFFFKRSCILMTKMSTVGRKKNGLTSR